MTTLADINYLLILIYGSCHKGISFILYFQLNTLPFLWTIVVVIVW